MKLGLLTLQIGCLMISSRAAAQVTPSTPRKANATIREGPALELSRGSVAIIKWKTDNPGGSPLHYGVVHYGTDRKHLSQTARSPVISRKEAGMNPGNSKAATL